jgi:L-alanine-DL-glutamate epimerase-like enolase superfamily enzyme
MKLEYKCLDLQLAHAWTIARTRGMNSFRVIIIELADADGTTGLGEAAPVTRYNESVETVEAFLRKVDSRRLSFDDLSGSNGYLNSLSQGDRSAKCAVNIALFDGAAKRAGKSLADFLGLSFQEQRHVTSFTIGIDKPEVIHKKVLAAEKYPVLKMKVGVPEDKINWQVLRNAAPTKPVRVDANEGWSTKEQALEMIEWLARDGRVQFVEQPLPASKPVKDWAWLKQRSPLPIFGDESYHLARDAASASECFHGVNVKLVKTGGITAGIEALQAARAAGLKTMLGCMIETSVLITAGAHLAGLCDYLDLDGNLLITNDPYLGVTTEDGMLSFINAPGKFGLRVKARVSGRQSSF